MMKQLTLIGLLISTVAIQTAAQETERKYEVGTEVTWWLSAKTQFGIGYTYQRIYNPGQVSALTPFTVTFAPNVIANNNLFWTSLTTNF